MSRLTSEEKAKTMNGRRSRTTGLIPTLGYEAVIAKRLALYSKVGFRTVVFRGRRTVGNGKIPGTAWPQLGPVPNDRH